MPNTREHTMAIHAVVTPDQWSLARRALLEKEKDFLKLRDELSQTRRELPWERVTATYGFEGAAGRETLADLFGAHSQLIVYHFNAALPHLAARDVGFAAISRAPHPKLKAFVQRMGWQFKWVSSAHSEFNYDYHVSFRPEDVKDGKAQYNEAPYTGSMTDLPGFSVFSRDADGLPQPMAWVRLHDLYTA